MSNQLLKRIPLVLRQSNNRIQIPTLSITNNSRIAASRCLQTKSDEPRKTEKNQSYTLSDLTRDEVKHHSKLAFDWWDPKGALRALHSLNKLRVPFICGGLEAEGKIFSELVNTPNVLRNQTILEVGCGGGILTENLAHLGANVTALDLSEDLIEVARQHLSLNANQELVERIQYKIEPVEIHALETKNFYDAVVLSEVLEHVDDKVSFLTACVKALKPGGIIFISTLNKTIPMWVVGVLIGEYMLQAIPIGTHHYSKMISPLDVERILNTLNCDTKLVKGSTYNFLRNYWRWINTTCTFYAMYAVKRNK